MYTKIAFKLTPARIIEIKLTDSVNDGIRFYYYYWMNTIFSKKPGGFYRSNALWIRQAHKIFKKTLATGTLKEANLKTLEYIWRFYEARPGSKLIVNGKNYWLNVATRSFAFIIFNQQSENNGE